MSSSFKEIFPSYCIRKVCRLRIGEVLNEKVYISPRPPPKISLRHDHDWTRGKVQLGSTVDQQSEEKLFDQTSFSNQPNQFQIQFVID